MTNYSQGCGQASDTCQKPRTEDSPNLWKSHWKLSFDFCWISSQPLGKLDIKSAQVFGPETFKWKLRLLSIYNKSRWLGHLQTAGEFLESKLSVDQLRNGKRGWVWMEWKYGLVWVRVCVCVRELGSVWLCMGVCVSVRACVWSESLRETKKSSLLLMSLEIDGISVRLWMKPK